MKYCKRAFSILLVTILLLCITQATAAQSITLTAVNDQFLPLSANTMPTRKSGEMYVPYSVFTGSLGISSTYSAAQKTLVMSGQTNSLTFYLSEGYVYDQNMTSYSQSAYFINNTVYVSVKLICRQFGFSYSLISSTYPILRITNDDALLSDHSFVENSSERIRKMVSTYQAGTTGGSSGGSGSTQLPEIPVTPPKTEEQVPHPSTVYLAFTGKLSEHTPQILDALHQYRYSATFFLPAESALDRGDDIRRMVAAGHGIGLSVTADSHNADPAVLLQSLSQQNDRLLLLCGISTRLVLIENGSAALSMQQRDALASGGYRLWDASLDSQDNSRTAYRAAKAVLTAFQRTTEPTVVRLRHTSTSDSALTYILRYMHEIPIPSSVISVTDTPMNEIAELR